MPDTSNTLLCVSFGTSVPAARADITAAEEAMRAALPAGWGVARAFTSPTIRAILQKRGERVPGLGEALDALAAAGTRRVAVQPTHLLYGFEYDKMKAEAAAKAPAFDALRLGRPLLADHAALHTLAAVLAESCPEKPGTAYVFMGHGTGHSANAVYPALQEIFAGLGRADILVGTVEGTPTLDDVRAALGGRYAAVELAPLMLVAGDHARNDMTGPAPQSWQNRLRADGFAVHSTLRGLGRLDAVRELYAARCRETVAALENEAEDAL